MLVKSGKIPSVRVPGVKDTVCDNPHRSWITYTAVLQDKMAQDYVEKISSAFNATVSSIARETWLSNYVEYSLANVVGLKQLHLVPRIIETDIVRCGIVYSEEST